MQAIIVGGFLIALLVAQIYWALQARAALRRLPVRRRLQWVTGSLLLAICVTSLWLTSDRILPDFQVRTNSTRLEFRDVLAGAILWWLFSSTAAFLIALPATMIGYLLRPAIRAARKWLLPGKSSVNPQSPARLRSPGHYDRPKPASLRVPRRDFLSLAGTAAVAFPFVAGGYAALCGRLNLEVTHHKIRISRLPKAFQGFRIVQLSDIHISPFMTAQQIAKYVSITNSLRPELIALTGDFLTWDTSAQAVVAHVLGNLTAPFGVWACLGNHESWARAEDSMALHLESNGIRTLRDSAATIAAGGEHLNLIGIEPSVSGGVPDQLIAADRVNILLSHYPTVFDDAAAQNIDLTLAGHTHGGQVKLDFLSPGLMPAALNTPYVSGWFEQPGGQLYVNRGIGTIGVPMRIGVRPEIAILELV